MKIDSLEMIHKNGNILDQTVTLPLKRKSLSILNNNSVIVNNNVVGEEENAESNDNNNNDYVDNDDKLYENEFKCPVCAESFVNVEFLDSHLQKHPNYKPTCKHCGEVFVEFKLLIKHAAMHVTDKCAIRNNQINLKILNYFETKNPYQKLAEASQSYRCNFCHEYFIGSQINAHWKQCKHLQSDDSNSKYTNSDESVYNADKSPKDDSDDIEETEEMKSHFLAGLNLQSKSDRLPDEGSSPEKQDDDKSSPRISKSVGVPYSKNIFIDDDKNDEEDDPFKLEVRDMKRRGEFPCRICKKIFRNLRALKGHARVHISGNRGIMPYECNICTFSTSDKSAVIRHIRNHNGDHPYKCQLCFSTFTTKANCERHLRNAHRKTTREDIKKLLIDMNNKSQNNNIENKLQSLLTGNTKKPDLTESLVGKKPDDFKIKFNENFYKKVDKCDDPAEDEKSMHIYDDGVMFTDKNNRSDADDSNNSNDSNNNSNAVMMSCKKLGNDFPINPLPLNADYKYSNFHLPGGLDMRMTKPEKQYYGVNYKTYNDIIVASGPIPTVIRDNGFIKAAPFESNYPQTDSDLEEPLDLSVDVLDLSKKKDENGDDSGAEDLSVKTRRESYSEKSETLSPIPKPINPLLVGDMARGMFFGKGELPYNFPNNQMITNFSSYFIQNPNANLFSNNPKLEPDFTQLVANAAERYEEIRQNVSAFVDFKKAESVQTDEALHESKIPAEKFDNAKFNPSKDISGKSRNNKSSTVKMVMKDGVLVEKQKQRRYRTEKPFSCAYCSGRFTLRSNMDRHVKQQHPGFWRQRQRSGSSRSQRTKSAKEDCSEINAFSTTSELVSEPETISHDMDYSNAAEKRSHSSASEPDVDLEDTPEKTKKRMKCDDGDRNVEEDDDDEEELVIDEEMGEHDSEEKSSEITSANTSGEKESTSKEENPDLASVRSLLDNVSTQMFSQYFHSEDDPNKHEDGSEEDEEGLVAGSSSEGNGSGGEENKNINDNAKNSGKTADNVKKKKSAYSSAPNRVHCDFCYRSFPWASSLRRHTLTHTGQKPYKCSNCPLLFTTKSNCDRHFLRKHRSQMNDSNSQTSTITVVTTNDNERSSTRLIPNFSTRNVPERPFKCSHCPSSTFSTYNNLKKHIIEKHNQSDEKIELNDSPSDQNEVKCKKDELISDHTEVVVSEKAPEETKTPVNETYDQNFTNHVSSDLPFKCHLCDRSFGERQEALDHMGESHSVEFQHLICKGALDMNVKLEDSVGQEDGIFMNPANSDENNADHCRGRFPDYSSRKVICAFCLRRFWSAEDLRRHMRTHTGERPFACDICQRRFTLKHSMLRHRKKHSNKSSSFINTSGENSPNSDDDEPSSPSAFSPRNGTAEKKSVDTPSPLKLKVDHQDVVNDDNSSFFAAIKKEVNSKTCSGKQNDSVDLIAKLLDIDDKSLVDDMLTNKSADDVAKLLGVEK